MQFLSRLTDAGDKAGLDVHVHIFQGDRPFETARLDLRADGLEPLDDLRALGGREHLNPGQHARMGNGAGDVLPIEPVIETNRCGEGLDERIGAFGKTSAPRFGGRWGITHAGSSSKCNE